MNDAKASFAEELIELGYRETLAYLTKETRDERM
jgi:hypothetical protein